MLFSNNEDTAAADDNADDNADDDNADDNADVDNADDNADDVDGNIFAFFLRCPSFRYFALRF